MLLADRELREALRTARLVVTPLREPVQPSSLDLRLGNTLRRFSGRGHHAIDPTVPNDDLWDTIGLEEGGAAYEMPAGAFILGHTYETVELAADLAAYVDGRSTLARNGLSVHVTAGFIDPGFRGQITLELVNVAPYSLLLKPGMPIAQLVVHEMSSKVERPYGDPRLGSKYQGQVGATLARGLTNTPTM